ncbi:antitoxin [Nocardia sp. SSK8]|uniref:antitoxin n=1 Tax=Nocardia sp. SSK8 TaxID=3120154 RepID=UPI00300B0732
MRTTLTLDADVARLVEDAVHRARSSMKQVINDALRRALSQPRAQGEAFQQQVHVATLAPGLDLAGFNRLADELEDQAIVDSMRERGAS